MDTEGRAEQRRLRVADGLEMVSRKADCRALGLVRHGKPPVELKGVMRRGEQHAAVDQYRGMIEAQADPLDQRRQMPGIDRLAVDRGLPADCVEPGAPGPGRSQRVRGECGIEAGDRAGGMFESAGERHRQAGRAVFPGIGDQDRPPEQGNIWFMVPPVAVILAGAGI